MRDNQVTVTGPEPPERVYSEIVNQLPYGKVLELADGRWGVRTLAGVVTFGSGGMHKDRISFLHILNDSVACRVLSGTVEITYKPAPAACAVGNTYRPTVKDLDTIVQDRTDEINRQRRDYA